MHVASSRGKRDCETIILRGTLKPGEYELLSSAELGRKEYKLASGNCGSGTEESGSLSGTSDSRSEWMRNERRSKRRHTKQKEGPLRSIDGHPPHPEVRVHPGESSQEQSQVWT